MILDNFEKKNLSFHEYLLTFACAVFIFQDTNIDLIIIITKLISTNLIEN